MKQVENRMTRRIARPRRGLAMALVLMALAVAVVIGLSFLAAASTSTPLARTAGDRLEARLAAESGLAIGLAYMESDPSWRANRPNGQWVAGHPLGDGSTVDIYGEDGDGVTPEGAVVGGDGSLSDDQTDQIVLTAVGAAGDARYAVRAVVAPAVPSTLAVSERITVRDTALIDSYSSTLGAYSATNRAAMAVISSNDVARPNMTFRDAAWVNGNVYVGPGGDPNWAIEVLDAAAIVGSRGTLPAAIAATDPVVPTISPSIGGVSYSGGTNVLNSDLHCDTFELKNNGTLEVRGDVWMVVEDDFVVDGNAVIDFGANYAYGIATKNPLSVTGSSVVDGYDSSVGNYGGTNSGQSAALATNSTANGAIIVGSEVHGSLYSGPGSDPDTAIQIGNSATVTGHTGALEEQVAIPDPPAWPNNVGPNLGDVSPGGGTFILATNLHVDDLDIGSTTTVRVHGHRTLRVNGDLRMNGGARLELQNNSSLKLYVGGEIRISGGARINATVRNPSLVTIYSLGSGEQHSISGNASEVYAIVDSPNSSLELAGNAELYGTFMGRELDVTGNAELHLDMNPDLLAANPRLPVFTSRLTVYARGDVTVAGSARVNPTTGDPERVLIHQIGGFPVSVGGQSQNVATVLAPDALVRVGDNAQFTGRITARDLLFDDQAVVTADASGGTAAPGLLAVETVEARGSARLEATGGSALLASNAAGTIAISVEDAAVVRGDAFTGPGGSANAEIRVEPAAQLTGTRANLAEAVTIELPADMPGFAFSVGNYSRGGSNTTVLSSDLECDDFRLSASTVLEIDGDVTIVATGDVQVVDQAQIRLLPGASLTLVCQGAFDVSGDARVNAAGDRLKMLINHAGAALDIRDRAIVNGTIVAPSAELRVGDTAQVLGSFLGRRLTVSGQAQVHYDRPTAPRALVWVEQQ